MKWLVILAVVVAACDPAVVTPAPTLTPAPTSAPKVAPAIAPTPASLTFRSGDNTLTDWKGGLYLVTWDAGGCTSWKAWIAPSSGAGELPLPVTDAKDSATFEIPAGSAYMNSTAQCSSGAGWSITFLRA